MTIRKPSPPTNFRSPEPRTLEDLRKLVAYLREHDTYLEAQTGGGGGSAWLSGAGAPSSGLGANGDHYIDTTNGDAYERAAGSWGVILNLKGPTGATGPAGPTGATGPAGPTGPAGSAGVISMYTKPPAVAGSIDDEFSSGSADLATRGWNVVNASGTTMTRVGDVTKAYPSGLTSTQYRSTLTASGLLFQSVSDAHITKPVTGSWTFYVHMEVPNVTQPNNAYYAVFSLYNTTPGRWTTGGAFQALRVLQFAGSRQAHEVTPTGATVGRFLYNHTDIQEAPWGSVIDWDSATKNWNACVINPRSDKLLVVPATGGWSAPGTFTLASVGVQLQTLSAASDPYHWVVLRCIRQYALGTWPGI